VLEKQQASGPERPASAGRGAGRPAPKDRLILPGGRLSLRGRVLLVGLAPLGLVAIAALGYRLIEGWPLFDALYMAVITLTTIGFGEVHPLSPAGRAFTILVALGGIFTLFFATTELLRVVVSGELHALLGKRRMEKRIATLSGHVIVCGFGRMGRQICQEFSQARVPFVIVDRSADRLGDLAFASAVPLVGDATEDEVLRQAGIDRARAVVVAVAADADNVFITMSARLLNDRVPIVSRAEEETTVPKLLRAGASRVISPYVIGGGRVAQAVLRPAVLDFIEVATRSEHLDLQIEELAVRSGGTLGSKSLRESGLRTDLGLIVVAIKQRGGHMIFNPPDEAPLNAGDTLIVLGRREQLDRAGALA
jgi:voltage-gated potassium channel